VSVQPPQYYDRPYLLPRLTAACSQQYSTVEVMQWALAGAQIFRWGDVHMSDEDEAMARWNLTWDRY
jgi:hypothetical protein